MEAHRVFAVFQKAVSKFSGRDPPSNNIGSTQFKAFKELLHQLLGKIFDQEYNN